jgi:solute:Na+ symporter, SSS family
LYLIRDLLPNGLLGLAIAGLLASFMAGMAANISAFNTVFSYDLWQTYVMKDRPDGYYLAVGRWATVAATVIAIGTATFAASYSNIMAYLQTLFGFFNAPLFATFILGMFWKRMSATAGWVGLVSGTAAAVLLAIVSTDVLGGLSQGWIGLTGQGASFAAAGAAFVVDIVVSVAVTMVTRPREESELRGLVYSLTPKEDFHDASEGVLAWYQQPTKLAGIGAVIVIILNIIFW